MSGFKKKLLALGTMLCGAAAWADAPTSVWELECKPVPGAERMGCVARTLVLSQGSGQSVLRVDLLPQGATGNANAVLRLFLPHGVALNAQVAVQIDGGEVYKLPLMSSDREGVQAYQPIGADVVEQMRKGDRLIVSAVTVQGALAVNEVSLVGLTLALDSAARLMGGAAPETAVPEPGNE